MNLNDSQQTDVTGTGL